MRTTHAVLAPNGDASSAGGSGRDSIRDIWGERTPYFGEGQWPERVDELLLEAPERWVQSACVLCSNGCGLDIGVKGNRIVGVRGRGVDESNRGRLGPKGLHGWKANHASDRLVRPLIRTHGTLKEASWDDAMSLIVEKSKTFIERYTGSSIGFYTSGQLMLEEYYALAIIGKAGICTPHMDGNTRLCTASAAAALKESFGSDGQPGTYRDLDVADCVFLVGHNMAETDTVLWMRVLDRRRGPNPPKLVCIDTRGTPTSAEADVHLAPKPGTNVAVLNGLLHLLICEGSIDRGFIERHTQGFEGLAQNVAGWTPERVEVISGVPAPALRAAAKLLGEAKALLSTVLQGVYQSMQATAAAVQVNNLNLVRGMIGRPGCGILQMNGQPTSENTRECGADGDLPGFRNWENPKHVEQLATLWNVDPAKVPHWAPPTHALQIFRYAEEGSLRMLWIQATNPAVSLPDLARIRSILSSAELFVVAQDGFPTETTALADVVLPAALWGEKTGTFTNVDRTVHLARKAIEPPGEARADLEIFLDYARRMDFRDKDGHPLITFTDPESAFEAWKACTRGRPCDYTGLSYEKLSRGSGLHWPCNEQFPEGQPRLYEDFKFPTSKDECENFGHDLVTGAAVTAEDYERIDPQGRAFLKPAEFQPPHETPTDEYPLWLTTGRVVHHFHTRTKTGRVTELQAAAPDTVLELSAADARTLGVADGDWVKVESRRGLVESKVRVAPIERGRVFLQFHYGYWDDPRRARAANELTIFEWDAVSKQPHFKYAAVRVTKIDLPTSAQPDRPSKVSRVLEPMKKLAAKASEVVSPPRPHVREYLGLLEGSEKALIDALEKVAEGHRLEPDIFAECQLLAKWSRQELAQLRSLIERYGEAKQAEPRRVGRALEPKLQQTGFGLVRDLHDCWLLANETHLSLVVLDQASKALRDQEMQRMLERIDRQNQRQRSWLLTRIKQASPQALVVPS